jgi:TetR/AcrR family transcriptional regulator
MSTTQPARAPAARSAGQQAILDAAVQLFSKHGFDGVSMRTIAQEAGVSKSNIYHHFRSKEELYLAIMQSSAAWLSELVDTLAEGDGTFEQRLRAFAQGHMEHLFAHTMTVRLLLREVFTGDEKWQRLLIDHVVGDIVRRLRAIFEKGQAEGVLRADLDPGLCAMQILGGDFFYFQSYGMLKFIPEVAFAQDRELYSKAMADILLGGMLVANGRTEASS